MLPAPRPEPSLGQRLCRIATSGHAIGSRIAIDRSHFVEPQGRRLAPWHWTQACNVSQT